MSIIDSVSVDTADGMAHLRRNEFVGCHGEHGHEEGQARAQDIQADLPMERVGEEESKQE